MPSKTMNNYLVEELPYYVRVCPVCNKSFRCFTYDNWAYYRKVKVGDKYVKQLLCSYHCMPATGIINENKYNDASLRRQEKETYQRHKEAYQAKHRELYQNKKDEIRKKAWLKFNDGSPEAEARRIERNRKAREKLKEEQK